MDAIGRGHGIFKLGGDHAAVYGLPSLAAAEDAFVNASVERTAEHGLTISLPDMNLQPRSFSLDLLEIVHSLYKIRESNLGLPEYTRYLNKNLEIDKPFLPLITAAAILSQEHDVSISRKKLTVSAPPTLNIPIQKGHASSNASAAASIIGLVLSSGVGVGLDTLAEVLIDAERVTVGKEGAGVVDSGAQKEGGYVYKKGPDVPYEPLDVDERIAREADWVLVDTGPKPETSVKVGSVAFLLQKSRNGVMAILQEVGDSATREKAALIKGDVVELGREMTFTHQQLKKLGLTRSEVNPDGLDKFFAISLKNGALGAKLSGGGGGGMGVALSPKEKTDALIAALRNVGFEASKHSVSFEGMRSQLAKSVSLL
jgi:mevalonate kinase